MTFIKVPKSLLVESINAYSDDGAARKNAFHKDGKAFLKKINEAINPDKEDEFTIRNNLGGMAGSGEVTLHSDHMYIQLSESCMHPGVQMMFRSCDSQKDYSGHTNNFAKMSDFANPDKQSALIERIVNLMNIEKQRKESQNSCERPRG